jgi:tetratricopeptide (TPR) repeat protein
MVSAGRYADAIEEYDKLLDLLPDIELEIRAKVIHNKAVALAELFLFDKAAKFFKDSYDMYPLPETFIEYLAAMRMLLSEDDYLIHVADFPEAYDESLELERRVEALTANWQQQIECQRLGQMQEWKRGGERSKYYQEADRVLQALKHSYRYSIGDI